MLSDTSSLLKDILGLENVLGGELCIYIGCGRNPKLINQNDLLHILPHLVGTRTRSPLKLLLHTAGGEVSAAAVLAKTMKRRYGEYEIYVPYRARSAATLLALGASAIFAGQNAVFGPIDPRIKLKLRGDNRWANAVDMGLLPAMLEHWFPTADHKARLELFSCLQQQYSFAELVRAYRAEEYVIKVADELLAEVYSQESESARNRIRETLLTGLPNHTTMVSSDDLKELGLRVAEFSGTALAQSSDILNKFQSIAMAGLSNEGRVYGVRAAFYYNQKISFFMEGGPEGDEHFSKKGDLKPKGRWIYWTV